MRRASEVSNTESFNPDGTTSNSRAVVFATAFHLVMNIIGTNLKDDLITKLKAQGLPFDNNGNPQMSLAQLESGLEILLGGGSELIMRYIRAEMQKLG